MDEITFELTDYCPHNCKYCSSESTNDMVFARFLKYGDIFHIISNKQYKRIILSGGEPLSHPYFYYIYKLCKKHTDDVVVYSNLLTHIVYNANVIDGIYVEANLTVNFDTKKINILKRIEQGREKTRPEVSFSKNFTENCDCDNIVVKPDGSIVKSPCRKFEGVNKND